MHAWALSLTITWGPPAQKAADLADKTGPDFRASAETLAPGLRSGVRAVGGGLSSLPLRRMALHALRLHCSVTAAACTVPAAATAAASLPTSSRLRPSQGPLAWDWEHHQQPSLDPGGPPSPELWPAKC